ncbi:MAG: hypothetical protein QOF78_355 [Phycisphaerales bacterium]|jgi:hypothetical protein|nr:hypothetical protein [Phycisphaerales bacterium]
MGIATSLQQHLPPPITLALMRTKRLVAPSPAFRQFRRIHQRIGSPDHIIAGPFKGMRYLDPPAYLSKLLGTYENELHDAIARLPGLRPDVIVNIGSAEGYYSVGLARLLPEARMLAYDISALARYRTAKLAALNGVSSRVETRGYCSVEELQRVCGQWKRPLVLSDCEGFEWDLLDPAKAPNLRHAIILVETHEMCRTGVHQEIRKRFADSHEQTEITCRPRTAADLPPGVTLSPEEAALVMDEARMAQQSFLLLVPRA